MEIQLTMVGLVVSDMPTALRFYRLLGLDIPAGEDDKPFVLHRMGSGVTLFFDTVFTARHDAGHARPARGSYQTLLEFYLGDDAAVDATYAELTAAGYHGRMAPEQTNAPYAAMVDDPDGNVVLLTSDDALTTP
ncbi:VOC family protein [Cellulomonas sp. URHD0024]|uniref:VOC family protein n=1 Tax=Cellulomonas sp. URHD0024 TaxID=1302620 RepID=UPI000402331A|nr:VOC family protein [Cellulomonas sp. URHD0024]